MSLHVQRTTHVVPDGGGSFQRFSEFLSTFKMRLRAMAPGDVCAFPTGWMGTSGGHAIFFVLEREEAADSFALIVCNTGLGCKYHPQDISTYPKTKCRTCIRLGGIPLARLAEDGWLYVHPTPGLCAVLVAFTQLSLA
mgnify:CR=1 FL=1